MWEQVKHVWEAEESGSWSHAGQRQEAVGPARRGERGQTEGGRRQVGAGSSRAFVTK